MRAGVAVVTLVDDERISQFRYIYLVGAKQIYDLDIARCGTVEHPGNIPATVARHEAQIQSSDPGRRSVQNIEAIPVSGHHAGIACNQTGGAHYGRPVGAGERALSKN